VVNGHVLTEQHGWKRLPVAPALPPPPPHAWPRGHPNETATRTPVSRWPRRDWYVLLGLLAAVVGIAVVAALGRDDGTEDAAGSSAYEQTWSQSSSETTCAEWAADMTAQQRFAAAADMLTGARNRGDGGQGVPDDSLIRRFEVDVSEGCGPVATMTVAEAGASIYLIGQEQYRP